RFSLATCRPPPSPLFPYTTLFRSALHAADELADPHQEPGQQTEQKRRLESIRHAATPSFDGGDGGLFEGRQERPVRSCPATLVSDRKSTRLNSSHLGISYAVFCLK